MTDPKITLLKLNQNLNILQEREAKFAGNAPLDLLNQIEDHRRAIDLTRQAVTGELDVAQWQAALKPLLVGCQDGPVIDIETETYVTGDLVHGNQIITNIYSAPPTPLPSLAIKERHDLNILLNKVKTFWIEGVLEKSIHNIALIDLGKETQAEAVSHAWEQVLELPDQSRQTLPPSKKINNIFDEMNRALLILGTPGSGKTITLLQLACDLIQQVEADKTFSQPVPVIFNLSTWTKEQPLIEWLVAELSAKYQIPKRISRPWLENNRLLPLLDGLDEVEAEEQADCVEAINHFAAEFGLSGLVVCSRTEEYVRLPVRLKLNGAIRLQPLTLEQVYSYLEAAGSQLDVLRTALEVDDDLRTLVQSPLILGIMILAYRDIPVESLIGQANDSLEDRRKHLLDTYIERMFRRKGKSGRPYSDEQTKTWLSWLAQGMEQHNQGIFLIEQLQPSWLSSRKWVWVYVLSSRTISMTLVVLIIGLALGLGGAKYMEFHDTLIPGLGGWAVYGLICGLFTGIMVGIIDGIRLERRGKDTILNQAPSRRQQGINILIVWLFLGLTGGLVTGLFAGLVGGLVAVLTFALIGGILWGMRGSQQSLTHDIQPVEALAWSLQKGLKLAPFGLVTGFVAGLIIGWIMKLDQALVNKLVQDGFIFQFISENEFALSMGVYWAIMGAVMVAMFGGLSSKVMETKTIPNQGIALSARNSLIAGPGLGLIFGLIAGLLDMPFYGIWNGANFGLYWGLSMAAVAGAWYGGLDMVQHYTLRIILWLRGQTSLIYFHFLNYAVERIFLQRVGGGYIFIHRLLLEHFAAMDEIENETR